MLFEKLANTKKAITRWKVLPFAIALILGIGHVIARLLFVQMDFFRVPCRGLAEGLRCATDPYGFETGVKSFTAYTTNFDDVFMSHSFAFMAIFIVGFIVAAAFRVSDSIEERYDSWKWRQNYEKRQRLEQETRQGQRLTRL